MTNSINILLNQIKYFVSFLLSLSAILQWWCKAQEVVLWTLIQIKAEIQNKAAFVRTEHLCFATLATLALYSASESSNSIKKCNNKKIKIMQIISAAGFTLIPPRDKMANFVILKSPIKIFAQMFIYNHTNSDHNEQATIRILNLKPLPSLFVSCKDTHTCLLFPGSSFLLRWPDPHQPELVTSIWMTGPGSAVSVYVMWCGLLHPPLLSLSRY